GIAVFSFRRDRADRTGVGHADRRIRTAGRRGNAGCAVVAVGGDGAGAAVGHLDVTTLDIGHRVDAGGEAVDGSRTDVATVVDADTTRAAVVGVDAGCIRPGRRDGAAVVHVDPAFATGRIDAVGVAIHGRGSRFRIRRRVG